MAVLLVIAIRAAVRGSRIDSSSDSSSSSSSSPDSADNSKQLEESRGDYNEWWARAIIGNICPWCRATFACHANAVAHSRRMARAHPKARQREQQRYSVDLPVSCKCPFCVFCACASGVLDHITGHRPLRT